MANGFLDELRWRGMLQDSMPGVEKHLAKGPQLGYIGFDPTADSLHVGNLVQIMLLVHFQRAGHRPVALVGGATGMVGDPSGKSEERQLLDEVSLQRNVEGIRHQLSQFLDFNSAENRAELVNNYDWFREMGFLQFIRDVGKHITVNYMMAKDSVKKRLETGISFTEFSYQLVQGYDYYHLYKTKGCSVQMGGSDQWGNITTGSELIRRMDGGEAFAITTPLLTKADGSKFGKSEGGNIWLDPKRTSPYRFYQFWLNSSDEDVVRYVHIFTTWSQAEIGSLVMAHQKAPHLRALQKELASDITRRVHGEDGVRAADRATEILFGQSTAESLTALSEAEWLDVFEGVPQAEVRSELLRGGLPIIELLTASTNFLPSKGEAKRALKEGSIYVNKAKVGEDRIVDTTDASGGKFILLQRGRKTNFLVKVV
ncbi:MAG: tyrosine--tRNA ligase [Bacteroidota bacterium]|nr:tyrosine--tRNA ligase [Bacteroidota bacterium]